MINKKKVRRHDSPSPFDEDDNDKSDHSDSDPEVSDASDSEIEEISESEDESDSESPEILRAKPKTKRQVRNSNEIFKELIKKQLPETPSKWKLNINDMKRICKYIDTSIFDTDNCCIWKGYITNMNNSNKGTYVNFYFRNKKVALHRLLYSNFVAPLDSSEYLKFNCENKGICCNINHYERYKYSKNTNVVKKETRNKTQKKEVKVVTIINDDDSDSDKLTLDFN